MSFPGWLNLKDSWTFIFNIKVSTDGSLFFGALLYKANVNLKTGGRGQFGHIYLGALQNYSTPSLVPHIILGWRVPAAKFWGVKYWAHQGVFPERGGHLSWESPREISPVFLLHANQHFGVRSRQSSFLWINAHLSSARWGHTPTDEIVSPHSV